MGLFRVFWLLAFGDWLLACVNWVRLVESPGEIGFVSHNCVPIDRGDADFDIPGLERDAAVWWAWFVTPPVFGIALSSTMRRIIP